MIFFCLLLAHFHSFIILALNSVTERLGVHGSRTVYTIHRRQSF